jgi:thiol-disulfide isomerase/thioredoxin
MRNNHIYLLILNLILFTACGNSREIIMSQEVQTREIKIEIEPKVIKEVTTPAKKYSFELMDIKNNSVNIEVVNNQYRFLGQKEPIVLVNFFSTWCPPCIGQIPHLNNLKKKYIDKLLILGLLLYDEDMKYQDLNKFIALQKIDFFLSALIKNNIKFANFISPKLQLEREFSIPLMVLFLNGRYYTHYEGSIPEEMIESDIKQALNKIKGQ